MWPVEEISRCDSTQTWAFQAIAANPARPPFVVYSLDQQRGVGRQGQAWLHCGQALATSFCWPADCAAPTAAWPAWISLMVAETLDSLFPAAAGRFGLKWPNDLVIADKKLGGVLVHQKVIAGRAWLVAGVGLNLRWEHDPPAGIAVTDLISLGLPLLDPARMVQAMTQRIAQAVDQPQPTDWSMRFNARDVYLGQSVVVRGAPLGESGATGIHAGIDISGRIGVQTGAGLLRYSLGEVSLRGHPDT
ncbi:MAG: Biotin-(acetyl-CoA carboxylase) ligase [Pseudomonadota bacterium]|jgi:BirA family biotin operon repressor/biotin-[acetyl-CoA-carboxylase] ligase